jgi:hypothetical protein
MTGIRCVFVALAVSMSVAACASAPISVSARSNALSQPATPEHAGIRLAVRALEATCRERGWIADEDSMQTAMRWVGRLAGQDEGDEAQEGPVARYLRANELSLDDAELGDRIGADIREAFRLAGAVDTAALRLIDAQGGESRSALSRSLGDVETALAQSRDALATFDQLIAALPEAVPSDTFEALRVERDLLAGRSDSLRDRADRLAELRRGFSASPSLS